MIADVVTRAVDAVEKIAGAKRARTFDTAVQQVVRVLRTVPDGAVSEWSGEAGRRLRAIAHDVVERIERRLDGADDRGSVQQDLAAAIYDIRAAIGEADRWYRHHTHG